MAKKLASRFYQVSPTETLTITITGPDDPLVALDAETLEVTEGKPFALTPRMLSGLGGHHLLNIVFLFPFDGSPTPGYRIDVADTTIIDTIMKHAPDAENTAKVQIMVRVK
jgi:hypothetical protein